MIAASAQAVSPARGDIWLVGFDPQIGAEAVYGGLIRDGTLVGEVADKGAVDAGTATADEHTTLGRRTVPGGQTTKHRRIVRNAVVRRGVGPKDAVRDDIARHVSIVGATVVGRGIPAEFAADGPAVAERRAAVVLGIRAVGACVSDEDAVLDG